MSEKTSKTPQQRKEANLAFLKSLGIKTLENLPCIEAEEEVTLRSKSEVVKRAIALLLVSLYAEGVCTGQPRAENYDWIKEQIAVYTAEDFFSPQEKAFLADEDPSPAMANHFSWQYEGLAVLLWALGFLEKEAALAIPAKMVDVPEMLKKIIDLRSYQQLTDQAILRDKITILDETDLIYRYDWACVDERINQVTDNQEAWGVAVERHRALNWLTNYGLGVAEEWDEVGTDT